MVRRLAVVLRRPVFQVVVFCLGLLIFNWPLLGMLGGPPKASYFGFFFIWLAFVALYRLIVRAIGAGPEGGSGGNRDGSGR